MLFSGKQSNDIRRKYRLDRYFAHGSSAELYRSRDGVLLRLSTDAGSHNLMVGGAKAHLAFPKVFEDYGDVGPSDESDWDRYWLGAFEECESLDKLERQPWLAFVDEFEEFAEARDQRVAGRVQEFEHFLSLHRAVLEEVQLWESMMFVLAFAEHYDADLDVNRTNFMINREGRIVITDLVHGADPGAFQDSGANTSFWPR